MHEKQELKPYEYITTVEKVAQRKEEVIVPVPLRNLQRLEEMLRNSSERSKTFDFRNLTFFFLGSLVTLITSLITPLQSPKENQLTMLLLFSGIILSLIMIVVSILVHKKIKQIQSDSIESALREIAHIKDGFDLN